MNEPGTAAPQCGICAGGSDEARRSGERRTQPADAGDEAIAVMSYQYMSTGESKHLAVKYALVPLDLVLVHAEDIIQRVRARGEIEKRVTELKDAIRKLRAHREAASQEPVADDPLALWMEEDRS